MKYSLPPIEDQDCKVLILGSLPGEASLQAGQYYAFAHNQFWKILCIILEEPLPTSYEEKREMLLRHHIALWDVIHFAEREGSLDANIKNAVPNDIAAFLQAHPNIRQVILNGNEAERQYKKHFAHLPVPYIKVRSSSPVPAQSVNTPEEKAAQWRQAFELIL